MDVDFSPPHGSGVPGTGTMVTTPLKSPPPQDYAKKVVGSCVFYLVHTLILVHVSFQYGKGPCNT